MEQKQLAKALIYRWEMAEHRLIAVANSLAISNGRKVLGLGVPLVASQFLRTDPLESHCYSTSRMVGERHVEFTFQSSLAHIEEIIASFVQALRDEFVLLSRGIFLFCLFLPVLASSPALLIEKEVYRQAWLDLLLWTMEGAGPAFIKWGQWAATRPDLFPADICSTLEKLQTKAPQHSYAATVSAVETAFGQSIEHLFSEFDCVPVASGSIAQVHRAVLSKEGAKQATVKQPLGLLPLPSRKKRDRGNVPLMVAAGSGDPHTFRTGAEVAVKVRHPGVDDLMERDFTLMNRAATILENLPFVNSGPQLKESLMQFGAPMREQLDLRAEAAHLAKFGANFKWYSGIRFPRPAAAPLVAEDVLVESFEKGDHISTYIGADTPHNKRLAGLGLGCYLKMLLKDNFIHADLHPGNILVRLESPKPGSLVDRITKAMNWELRIPRLILLDVGMTAHLSRDEQSNLLSFFKHLTELNGAGVAEAIAGFSPPEAVLSPATLSAFKADMAARFAALDPESVRLNTQEVIADVMETIRRHGVHLRGVVSSVVITTMVLEGWSTALDPEIRILDTLKEILPGHAGERVGRALDKTMSCHGLAVI